VRKITKPTITVRTVFTDCISNIRDPQLKVQLTSCANLLETAEADLDNKFKTKKVHLTPQNLTISGSIGHDIMVKVYDQKMAKKGSPGRIHYDDILSSAPGGKCPLCSQRIATTLDHYLPKSKYPSFSVTPINLIPSCTDCNKGKLAEFPTKSEEQTLNPYYDDVENDSWLKVRLLQTTPIGFEYFVQPPASWTQLLSDRVEYHFLAFGLNELYSVHAVEEFQNMRGLLIKLYNNGGGALVKEHLKECYDSRKSNLLNSWQTALYEALSIDHWFCNGGLLT